MILRRFSLAMLCSFISLILLFSPISLGVAQGGARAVIMEISMASGT